MDCQVYKKPALGEKEEPRRKCALPYKISRSKRYIACSDVSGGFHSDISAAHPISSSGKPAKRLPDESEEIPARVQFSLLSGNGTVAGISELVEVGGVEPPSESTLTGPSPGAVGYFQRLSLRVPLPAGKPTRRQVR